MKRGRSTTRDPSPGSHRRRARLRVVATPCVVAVVAAFLVGDRHLSDHAVLAAGPAALSPAAPVTAPPTVAPDAPGPGASDVRTPASVSDSDTLPPGLGTQSIPEPALAAYQRAAVVIDAADHTCRLDWALLAGIGQVESDHGQFGGSHLDSQGVAHPAIIGLRLDGRHGTSVVRDTDAGRLDGDRRFDRAVGPMQFLPSTWAAVAVDGDGDGVRNVQDIDDAALGSAVYLCAGSGDLSTPAGARAALLRYNHSLAYVARVMSIAKSLRLSNVFTTVDPQPTTTQIVRLPHAQPQPSASNTPHPSTSPTSKPTSHPTSTPTSEPTSEPTSSPTSEPTDVPTSEPTSSPSSEPTDVPTSDPTSTPTDDPTDDPTDNPTDNPTRPAGDP